MPKRYKSGDNDNAKDNYDDDDNVVVEGGGGGGPAQKEAKISLVTGQRPSYSNARLRTK